MDTLTFLTNVREIIDESIKNCANVVVDIGRLNDTGIEVTRRINEEKNLIR